MLKENLDSAIISKITGLSKKRNRIFTLIAANLKTFS